jgi:hypothetical protein
MGTSKLKPQDWLHVVALYLYGAAASPAFSPIRLLLQRNPSSPRQDLQFLLRKRAFLVQTVDLTFLLRHTAPRLLKAPSSSPGLGGHHWPKRRQVVLVIVHCSCRGSSSR